MNKQDFEKLRDDLHKHHILCEGNACTSHPIFMVQKRDTVWGIDPEYDYDVSEVYDSYESESYPSIIDFLEAQDEDFNEEHIQDLCDFVSEEYESGMTCKSVVEKELEDSLWKTENDFVEFFQERGVNIYSCYGRYCWEDVTMFFTRVKSEAFCKQFQYRHSNLRIYVKSGWESEEYKDLIKAIIDGKLEWKDEERN